MQYQGQQQPSNNPQGQAYGQSYTPPANPQAYPQPQNPYAQQQGQYPPPGNQYAQPGYAPPTYPQPAYSPTYPMGQGFPIPSGVKTPILIAAIWHCILLVPSFFLIFTVIFAFVPLLLIILIVFEFRLIGKLNGQTPPSHHRGGAQALGILNIVLILGGDIVSLVCGIIAISNVGKMNP